MIDVRNLTKRFGGFVAVDGVSFDVRGGETFALLGPNGSGKTTVLKCLTGLAAPTSGGVSVGGFDLGKNVREAGRLMSYLPQRVAFQHFDLAQGQASGVASITPGSSTGPIRSKAPSDGRMNWVTPSKTTRTKVRQAEIVQTPTFTSRVVNTLKSLRMATAP